MMESLHLIIISYIRFCQMNHVIGIIAETF